MGAVDQGAEAATRARGGTSGRGVTQLSLAAFSRLGSGVAADRRRECRWGSGPCRVVLGRSTMFASVCVNPACARAGDTGSLCFTTALSSLRVGTLAIVDEWFPRAELDVHRRAGRGVMSERQTRLQPA